MSALSDPWSHPSTAWTAEALRLLPRGTGIRHEVVDGELRTMSPAGRIHGRIAARFLARLMAFVEGPERNEPLGECYAAETGFLLRRSPDTVRAPDVAFVRCDRVNSAERCEETYFPGPPDLAVEVVSPSDAWSDVEEKVSTWLGAGTLAVVVIDPQRRAAAVHRRGTDARWLAQTDSLVLDDLLPGWSLPLADLFD